MPILKALGNELHDPGGLVGTPNIGRRISEDTQLQKPDDKLGNSDAMPKHGIAPCVPLVPKLARTFPRKRR
jgi:hypothetical protein